MATGIAEAMRRAPALPFSAMEARAASHVDPAMTARCMSCRDHGFEGEATMYCEFLRVAL
jgi:hypothetical protein